MSRRADNRPRPPRAPGVGIAVGVILAWGGLMGTLYGLATLRDIRETVPPAPAVALMSVSQAVVDRDGRLLRPFTTDGGRWRLPVTTAGVDRRFIEMLLAYEDKTFSRHGGIAWSSMLRAAVQYAGAGRIVSGGSTLTMQVARLLERRPTRNLQGKILQMVHADMLERALSKDEILTLYLTLAPYGGNIEGVRAASLAYFGKEPSRLTTAECALLVALPQSPEARRPDRDPEAARLARDRVLDRMVVEGVIGAEEAEASKGEPIPKARRDFPMLAAHLAEAAVKARPNARQIELTVDRRLQAALERMGADRAAQMGNRLSVAIVVADQATGNVLASVGSAGLFNAEGGGYLDMTQAVRSPGSTLKPLIYGLAFELGMAHPESLIEDRPTGFNGYVPVNFDGFNRGTVTIRQALTESLNIPAIVVLDAVGPARLVARMKRANANPMLPGNTAPSLAVGLGGVGVTLRDLVSIYAAIGRGGSPVVLQDGVQEPPKDGGTLAPVLDPVAAWYVADILANVPPPLNGSPGRIAYKTGTSYGYRDAWAIGFDGRSVIGVWVGRPDNSAVPGITGIGSAAPILFESFDRLAQTTVPLRAAPAGVVFGSTAELPVPLKRFRHPDEQKVKRDAAPEIAYPEGGVDVDFGIRTGDSAPLTVKVRNGVPPFTFFANGAPIGRTAFARQESWLPDGPGFVTLSVVDAEGRSDSVKVFLD